MMLEVLPTKQEPRSVCSQAQRRLVVTLTILGRILTKRVAMAHQMTVADSLRKQDY
jgi:SUMO ligase MMS21 Smc5/6 complex component